MKGVEKKVGKSARRWNFSYMPDCYEKVNIPVGNYSYENNEIIHQACLCAGYDIMSCSRPKLIWTRVGLVFGLYRQLCSCFDAPF